MLRTTSFALLIVGSVVATACSSSSTSGAPSCVAAPVSGAACSVTDFPCTGSCCDGSWGCVPATLTWQFLPGSCYCPPEGGLGSGGGTSADGGVSVEAGSDATPL
jgi:hypothetical protein